ncbi:carbon-nitrogen family hydrolase [Virgibacillus siamensis]|uniref:carbon-nitrogen family hydrolase n=1 Tax=Virgibacillus siamensis TaxID=480071 RepID=UPI000984CAF9|nr:carbon-nitrogen family hydrolase [Virgibacillus siamensis]
MRYSIYQMDVIPGDPAANRGKVAAWLERAVKLEQPDIVVLPEMWTTGYTLPELPDYADNDGEPTSSFLCNLAKKYEVNIIGGSFANRKEGKIYNSSIAIDRSGMAIYRYDKIHLVPMLDEPKYLTGGENHAEVFELDGVKMGLIICYDLRFPELMRKLALDGAQVVHVVAEWPTARKEHWRVLQLARAIENQMFIVSSNSIGAYNGVEYAGTSMVIDPWGTVQAEGDGLTEQTISSSISLDITKKVRADVPVFSCRVPKFY